MAGALSRARAWLQQARNADGSWGYLHGYKGRPEPTLLCVLAGFDAPVPWLVGRDLGWARRLVPLALADFPEARKLVKTTLDDLETDKASSVSGGLGFDTSIPAWGWVPGTAAWVEPTATAILSLRRAGRASSPRVADGIRMLLNRQGKDGGWNYGNPSMLGKELESYQETTGWALLALQGRPELGDRAEKALFFLSNWLLHPSTLGMALLALAQDAWGHDPEDAQAALIRLQDEDGSWRGRVDLTALATSALGLLEGRHDFRV